MGPDDPETHDAEEFEFDESQEVGDSIDGMGFLTLEPSKSGYIGPQSGNAALQVLQSLPSAPQISRHDDAPTIHSNFSEEANTSEPNPDEFVDDYFRLFHPMYPMLHEGSFRARLSGALAKPKDGSWPLLQNMVLAIGAFSGDTQGANHDLVHFQAAKDAISLSVVEKGSLFYVQGLALMADYLQKRNKPNAGFAMIGVAWSMAMAIGLHREFGAFRTSPFSMEIRRRTWWTIYASVSAAQLTLGRPPASLIGINVRPPLNVDDTTLAVDMEAAPQAKESVTAASCLIAQIPLATIANDVQAALLTHQVPAAELVVRLDRDIEAWSDNLPNYLRPEHALEVRFELSRNVLLWRSYHLRIVLHRPYLFQTINRKIDITIADVHTRRCIDCADICVDSICHVLQGNNGWSRGFAWYATYWLVSASFVHAICSAYAPGCEQAKDWASRLQRAIQTLQRLAFAHGMADRARKILRRFHDRLTVPMADHISSVNALPLFTANNFGLSMDVSGPIQSSPTQWMAAEQDLSISMGFDADADTMWSWQPNLDLLSGADGNMYQAYQDGFGML